MNSIVRAMVADIEYFDDLIVRMIYHSAAIEGNTVTIDETKSMFIDGIMPNFKRKVTLREIHELTNLNACWHFMMGDVTSESPITISLMHEYHRKIMQNIDEESGKFKRTKNMVGGELTVDPTSVPTEMNILIDQLYNGWLAYAKNMEDIVRAAVSFHMRYEKIHPYLDGNGRSGRLLMNHVLIAQNVAPFVIKVEDKAFYYQCLRENNVPALTEYALIQIAHEVTLINRNGEAYSFL
ncbi:Fic family protein [Paenibacillus sp. V4I9]|uniref:Fic family protein n=1 Tax=Paenibacillus sp. V4I9 TaxID=3042308 RepID=UPI00278B6065|nr:Fic family protein [Paenibacillus sp. V4I9]MDQ0888821.1 Fic family protein [Paenibacillus sp. V4I9]